MRREDPTLHTIAAELGIHYSTISRVLNGSSENAKKAAGAETRRRIQEAADRIGYVPSPIARGLRTKRTGLIGVLVPNLQDVVVATIYAGVQQASSEIGYHSLVTNTLDHPATHERAVKALLGRRVDGLILGDSRIDSGFDDLRARGVPFVLVNRPHPDAVSVTIDDRLGGRLAGRHLLDIGRTDVVVLTGPTYARTAADRANGLVDVFAEEGIEVPRQNVLYRTFDASGGRAAAEEVLARPGRRPNALFVTNDFAAIGAMGALRDHGLRVPDDVALIGYNDMGLARELPIALTSVRAPSERMGAEGARQLFRLIEESPATSLTLPPKLVVRASTVIPGNPMPLVSSEQVGYHDQGSWDRSAQ